jgi:flagellar protein FlaJ
MFKTVCFNIAMLTVLGGLTMYGTTAALSQFLTNHILDTYAPTTGTAVGNLPGIGSGT